MPQEVHKGFLGAVKVPDWFPGVMFRSPACPLDEIVELGPFTLLGNNSLDLILHVWSLDNRAWFFIY